jgi:hypothetical protein
MGTTATVFILMAYGMKIQRLKREKERVRDMARKLGEYCNEHPSDNVAYNVYLLVCGIVF